MEMPKKSRLFELQIEKSIRSIALGICTVTALHLCFIPALKTQKVGFILFCDEHDETLHEYSH
jgi:hypothetical protein